MLYSVFTSVRRPPSDGVTFDSTYNQKNMAYFATNSASPSSGVQLIIPSFAVHIILLNCLLGTILSPEKKHAEIASETIF